MVDSVSRCSAGAPLFKKFQQGFLMFTQTLTYCQQSEGLNLYNSYQEDILKNADRAIEIRKIAMAGTIIGSILLVASSIFSWDPTVPMVITSVSVLAWFGSHQLVQKLEPEAQSLIHDLQKEAINNQNTKPGTQISFDSLQEFIESKKRLRAQLNSTST